MPGASGVHLDVSSGSPTRVNSLQSGEVERVMENICRRISFDRRFITASTLENPKDACQSSYCRGFHSLVVVSHYVTDIQIKRIRAQERALVFLFECEETPDCATPLIPLAKKNSLEVLG